MVKVVEGVWAKTDNIKMKPKDLNQDELKSYLRKYFDELYIILGKCRDAAIIKNEHFYDLLVFIDYIKAQLIGENHDTN